MTTRRTKSAERHAKRYADRKAAGQCTRCDAPALPGKTTCERHRLAARSRTQSYSERKIAGGLCVRAKCENPLAESHTLCQYHLGVKRELYHTLLAEVHAAYGGRCRCCGEADPNVLELDHVNNDGNVHRRTVSTGEPLLRWAKKNGYPDTLQLLCANCHSAKTITGDCSYRRTYTPACGRPPANDTAGGVTPGPVVSLVAA